MMKRKGLKHVLNYSLPKALKKYLSPSDINICHKLVQSGTHDKLNKKNMKLFQDIKNIE